LVYCLLSMIFLAVVLFPVWALLIVLIGPIYVFFAMISKARRHNVFKLRSFSGFNIHMMRPRGRQQRTSWVEQQRLAKGGQRYSKPCCYCKCSKTLTFPDFCWNFLIVCGLAILFILTIALLIPLFAIVYAVIVVPGWLYVNLILLVFMWNWFPEGLITAVFCCRCKCCLRKR